MLKRPTITDVASLADVSRSTVSHVLNNTRFVEAATRRRVLDAVDQLGYRPNSAARSLTTRRTGIVGMIISDASNHFFSEMLRGVEDVLLPAKYSLTICNTDEVLEREAHHLDLLLRHRVDGIIAAATSQHWSALHEAEVQHTPVVFVDRKYPGMDGAYVGVDNVGGAYLGTRHLFETYPAFGFSLAGFCAGLLALFLLIGLVLLALLLFNLVFTTVSELTAARAVGEDLPLSWATVGAAFADAFINMGRVIWDARLGFLAVGILGLLAAWGHQIGQAIDPGWGRPASALVVAVIMTFSTTTWVFAQWAQVAEWLAQSPELYVTRDLFAGSAMVDLIVSILLGLLAAAPLWMLWHQGYTWLTHAWLPTSYPSPNPPAPVADDYRRYTARLHGLKRGDRFEDEPSSLSTSRPLHTHLELSWFRLGMGLFALLILASGSTWLVQNAYHRVAIRLEHQTLYLRAADQPVARQLLHLDDDVRDLTIVNIDGAGSVQVALTGGPDCNDVIHPPERWIFVRRQGEYLHSALPLAGLPPGVYCLELHQEEGWGMYEYTLSHGGGRISRQLALATGLLTATTFIVAIGLFLLALIRLGVIAPAPYRSAASP